MKKYYFIIIAFFLVVIAGCSLDYSDENNQASESEEEMSTYYKYEHQGKGNYTYVCIDTEEKTITKYNIMKHSNKRSPSKTARYSGEYPNTLTATFDTGTYTYTINGKTLKQTDSDGDSISYKLTYSH